MGYPLSAIVGQDDLREALMVCAVHPIVGGVLVRGERGTAKSTAVRAVASMLGEGAPLVELPLGATLDRLVGTLDVRAAIEGEHRVEPGMLSRANGGVLYVDEVNLLADHLVDALLDAAASGAVTVERDGVSLVQEARFLLVGTMNPEEGELRPQLLDRFGLGVEIAGPREPAERAKIVRRRLEFDADPAAFRRRWAEEELALAAKIQIARSRVKHVTISEQRLLQISEVCVRLDLDGVRGDLVCAQAARALAALDGADEVEAQHVERAAHLTLRHRMRRDPLAPPPAGGRDEQLDQALEQSADDPGPESAPPRPEEDGPQVDPRDEARTQEPTEGDADGPEDPAAPADQNGRSSPAKSQPQPEVDWQPSSELSPPPRPKENDRSTPGPAPRRITPPAIPSRLPEAALRLHRGARPAGRRHADDVTPPAGRAPGGSLAVVDARPASGDDPIAALPTLLAGLRGDRTPQTAVTGGGRGALLCLIVDTSGSMGAQRRLSRVKGALEAALRLAYARRDFVAVVGFSGEGGQTIVAPGAPIEAAAAAVHALPAGGRTPLATGLTHAADLIDATSRGHHGGRARIAVLLTDGRADDRAGQARASLRRIVAACDRTVVVDLEDGRARLGLAAALAQAAGADLTRLVAPGAAEAGRRPRAA